MRVLRPFEPKPSLLKGNSKKRAVFALWKHLYAFHATYYAFVRLGEECIAVLPSADDHLRYESGFKTMADAKRAVGVYLSSLYILLGEVYG